MQRFGFGNSALTGKKNAQPVGASFAPTGFFLLLQIAVVGLQLTESFPPSKPSAKVRGFFILSSRKGPA
jgi:hypothetical protein